MDEAFRKIFGRAPQWVARAPGRVNLIGEHTDYNGGFVLPMAIDRHTQIAASASSSENTVVIRSTAFDEEARIDLARPIEPEPKRRWENYPRGVIAGFLAAGHELPTFDALIHSTVPMGGGLSSSAALEVAFATVLEGIAGVRLGPREKAALCRQAEHQYAGVPCGIMDQYVCTFARANSLLLIDCAYETADFVPFAEPGVTVLIIYTQVKHQLAASEYALRRAQCEMAASRLRGRSLREAEHDMLSVLRAPRDDVIYRRALHVVNPTCVRGMRWGRSGKRTGSKWGASCTRVTSRWPTCTR